MNDLCPVRKTASLSEIIGEFKSPAGIREVRAIANGRYNEETSQLLVELSSSVRPFTGESNAVPVNWLPQAETVKVSIAPSEALDAVKEIFTNWVLRVRKAIPLTDG